jgi:sortase B
LWQQGVPPIAQPDPGTEMAAPQRHVDEQEPEEALPRVPIYFDPELYIDHLGAERNEPEPPPPPCYFTLLQMIREETNNPDIVAFINIPGTNIQYAIVQGRDNEFYLERSIFRRWNGAGSIFMDFRNSSDFSDPSTILYGHHLRSRTKFSQLHNFRNRDFFLANRYIHIFTDEGEIVYEIFAQFDTHISFYYIQVHFEDDEFDQLLREMLRRNRHRNHITTTVTANDRIIVLSTCTSVDDDDRVVVLGVRVKG